MRSVNLKTFCFSTDRVGYCTETTQYDRRLAWYYRMSVRRSTLSIVHPAAKVREQMNIGRASRNTIYNFQPPPPHTGHIFFKLPNSCTIDVVSIWLMPCRSRWNIGHATCLHPALSCAAASILHQLYLYPAVCPHVFLQISSPSIPWSPSSSVVLWCPL